MKYLAFVILCCLCFYGCFGDRGNGCVSSYMLETPLTITPANGILNIGDTLHVSMITDNTMLVDLLDTGRVVNIEYYNPYLSFLMPSLDTFPVEDGMELHDIIIDSIYQAPIVQGSVLSDFIPFQEIVNGEFESKIEFKVVLKSRGLFSVIVFPTLFEIDRNNFIEFEDRCGGRCCSSLDTQIRINEGETNEDLLSEENRNVEAEYWIGSETTKSQSGIFYFMVE